MHFILRAQDIVVNDLTSVQRLMHKKELRALLNNSFHRRKGTTRKDLLANSARRKRGGSHARYNRRKSV
jgi:hypothetical protein